MFWMRAAFEQMLDHIARARADIQSPGQEAPRRPVLVLLVRFGHVCHHGGMRALALAARVGRDALTGCEALHRGGGETHIDAVFDVRMRHRVVVPIDLNVVVDVHARFFPVGVFVRTGGQRFKCGAIQRVELRTA